MARWTEAEMPDQTGKVMVVTGANSGLGLASTQALAAKGATVVMGCRDEGRAEAAVATVKAAVPAARLEVRALDLASLASVARFAAEVRAQHPRLDALVNNAGVMALPRALTKDGFETQLGTNHLGHFALTLRLLPALEAAPAPRVVTVASNAHRWGRVAFDDLMGERRYAPWAAYCQAKLANLLFAYELERRLRASGCKTLSLAAHPGYAATNLQGVGPRLTGSRLGAWLMKAGNALLGMSPEQGALPQLYAATSPEARGGEYYGPDGLLEFFGWPKRVDSNKASKDEEVAGRLWGASEELTHVSWPASVEARPAAMP
ncbi:MAG: SDR family oxidoreductase [Myxococcales bacterium]|nr:SDR family oxidoreductase [Myxococcales bacterium]